MSTAAILDGRVVWSESAPGWVPASELEPYEQAAASEAAGRADAERALQALGDSKQQRADEELAFHAAADPVGYATATRVAEQLAEAGYGTPRIVRGQAVVAHAWRVEAGRSRVSIDPDPFHFDRVYRSRIDRKRFTVRSNLERCPTVASTERYPELRGQLMDLHHVSEWRPEPALLPSPDGGPVNREHLDAARHVRVQASKAFRDPLAQAVWCAEEHAWIWTLPDGATVALAAATGERSPKTSTGSHRLVIYLNRYVLRRDDARRIIWRNLTPSHLTGDAALESHA